MKKVIVLASTAVLLLAFSAVARDKVVVIPLNSSGTPDKLWGEGREGTTATPQTTVNGISIARSNGTATWDGAAAVCPKNTWVCSAVEAQNLDVTIPTPIVDYIWCDGNISYTTWRTWVRDQSPYPNRGISVAVSDIVLPGIYELLTEDIHKCFYLPVWCCSYAN